MYSTWKYSGESELLMLEYKNGNLFFDRMISFYLDNMIRDKVIVSIPQFFQQLFRICKNNNGLTEISIILERGKMAQITKEGILECIPARLRKFFTQDYKVLKENDEKIEG